MVYGRHCMPRRKRPAYPARTMHASGIASRKYVADPSADMAGYERTLERTRHYLEHVVFECDAARERQRSSLRRMSGFSSRPTYPAK